LTCFFCFVIGIIGSNNDINVLNNALNPIGQYIVNRT